jgi:hypothetical protein
MRAEDKRELYRAWMNQRVKTLRRDRKLSKKASWQLAQTEWLELAKRSAALLRETHGTLKVSN